MIITDFSNFARQQWVIVNDGIMGGESSSRFQINFDGNGVFLGNISLANNGGFASVKNQEPISLKGYRTIELKVKGDGKRYSFRFQTGTETNPDKWWYEYRFDTKADEWMTVQLPIAEFEPTYRGQTPKNVPEPDLSAIVRYGFLISDGQSGNFRLETDIISAIS
ncbi:CIA30 family protein [Rhodohalobacter sp. SW132]|uniref:CIA30 family protein n=1 Tax=Rhodohalobacter sp. SW132 TaxID=2293433 RepID=UPI000E22ECC8|nr:CIA30 family protein [Rhodohalobacter sp. SW132]REL25060.1 CIA30 family protein [Rhodohalobacter sp. SW132]